jgi:hypothetical protein
VRRTYRSRLDVALCAGGVMAYDGPSNRAGGLSPRTETPATSATYILINCRRMQHEAGWHPSGATAIKTPRGFLLSVPKCLARIT